MSLLNYRAHFVKSFALMMLVLGVSFIPNQASAGKLHIHVPGLSIGFHGKHHDRHYKKRKYYHGHNYRYRNRNYYPRSYYYDNYYYRPKARYYKRKYNDRYYNRRICPTTGRVLGYIDEENCYTRKGRVYCD